MAYLPLSYTFSRKNKNKLKLEFIYVIYNLIVSFEIPFFRVETLVASKSPQIYNLTFQTCYTTLPICFIERSLVANVTYCYC